MGRIRPILALDVDGPIALMGDPPAHEVFECQVAGIPLLISRSLPGRLERLADAFQIVWASRAEGTIAFTRLCLNCPTNSSRERSQPAGDRPHGWGQFKASSWGRQASTQIAPLVGLPAGLPHIPFKATRKPGRSYKLSGLKRWLRDAPAAFVDDEVGADLWRWASQRPNTLLVEVDPRLGLVQDEVERLLEFARRF